MLLFLLLIGFTNGATTCGVIKRGWEIPELNEVFWENHRTVPGAPKIPS